MLQKLTSMKSTHWMMWSSPLLLIVLVFTLNSPSGSSPHAVSSTTVSTTTTLNAPSHRAQHASVSVRRRHTTSPTPTTTLTTAIAEAAPTNSPNVARSSSKTGSNAATNASGAVASGPTGDLAGQLSPSFDLAEVPLTGPGGWTLESSAPLNATLDCRGVVSAVAQTIQLGRATCQLSLSAQDPSSTLTWQLTTLA